MSQLCSCPGQHRTSCHPMSVTDARQMQRHGCMQHFRHSSAPVAKCLRAALVEPFLSKQQCEWSARVAPCSPYAPVAFEPPPMQPYYGSQLRSLRGAAGHPCNVQDSFMLSCAARGIMQMLGSMRSIQCSLMPGSRHGMSFQQLLGPPHEALTGSYVRSGTGSEVALLSGI